MNIAKKIEFFYNENDFSVMWDKDGNEYPTPWAEGYVDARTRKVIEMNVSHGKSIKHLKEKIK